MTRRLRLGVAALALTAAPAGAWAQEVVQPLPPAGADALNAALLRLASNPRDVTALIEAGEAALKVGDIDAAMGFFGRARDLSPENARLKLGMATAFARSRRSIEALRLFAEAERAGIAPAVMAADRGLAFDLVGDAASAQQNYRLALARGPDPEMTRRLALSQAIAGDRKSFEATLLPLLQARDLGAYRTRAFGLAILGEVDEAVKIAEQMMPRDMAARMTPYLRFMPQLTQAQQAAAGNLGIFPRAATATAAAPAPAATPRAAPVRTADARLQPAGPTLGTRPASAAPTPPATTETVRVAQAPPPAAQPSRGPIAPARVAQAPAQPVVQPAPAPAQPAARPAIAASLPVQVARTEPPPPAQPRASAAPPVLIASATPPPPSVVLPSASSLAPAQPTPAATPSGADEISLADAFAAFTLPASTPAPAAAAGAVDITAIRIPREVEKPDPPAAKPAAAKPAAKPAKPAHPARHWVQVATGKNLSALAFDWRRIARKADGKLDKKGPFTTPWVEANRLLAGPYDSAAAAREVVKQLKALGIDSFTFASAAGEEIKPLK